MTDTEQPTQLELIDRPLLSRRTSGGEAELVHRKGTGLIVKIPGREEERVSSYARGAHRVFEFAGEWPDYADRYWGGR